MSSFVTPDSIPAMKPVTGEVPTGVFDSSIISDESPGNASQLSMLRSVMSHLMASCQLGMQEQSHFESVRF